MGKGNTMTPLDPQGAVDVSKTAMEQGSDLAKYGRPLLIALIAYSLMLVPRLMKIQGIPGKLAFYVSHVSGGAGTAFVCMLCLPLMGIETSPEMMIISGMVGFHMGKDGLQKITDMILTKKGLG